MIVIDFLLCGVKKNSMYIIWNAAANKKFMFFLSGESKAKTTMIEILNFVIEYPCPRLLSLPF